MNAKIETLIIGAGQAGLSVSYCLTRQGRENLVLEAAGQPANAWRNDRWDSFTLVTPNWSFRLPGAEYKDTDPDGFMNRDILVKRFEQYIDQYSLPVRFGVRALAVEPGSTGYLVETDQGRWEARNVVVATGLYQKPKIPTFGSNLSPEIMQVASGKYRSPQALPPGAVLVVGSSQSGCQIAEELCMAGRQVYLCVGSAGRAPRRYRGRDVFEWLDRCGFLARTVEHLPSPQVRFAGNPQLTGKDGGRSLNLHQFYRDGIRLLGRLQGVQDGRLYLAPDLKDNLAKVDRSEANIVKMIDEYIAKNGIQAPEEQLPSLQDGYAAQEILTLSLKEAGISAVIWALGYTFDFGLVKLPVFEEIGFPQTDHGATRYPGLYFAGMPWLPGQNTGLLVGVGEHAAAVAAKIVA